MNDKQEKKKHHNWWEEWIHNYFIHIWCKNIEIFSIYCYLVNHMPLSLLTWSSNSWLPMMTQSVNRKRKKKSPRLLPALCVSLWFHMHSCVTPKAGDWEVDWSAARQSTVLLVETHGHTSNMGVLGWCLGTIQHNISSCSLCVPRRTLTSPKDLLISMLTSVLSMQYGNRNTKNLSSNQDRPATAEQMSTTSRPHLHKKYLIFYVILP